MAFLTLKEILAGCQGQGWAVPAFDVVNHETVLAVLEGAAVERAPVILMIYPSLTPVAHWPGLVALMRAEAERAGVPVCLHLDHSPKIDLVSAALEVGFSSVMIDGSTLPLAENVAVTRQAAAQAHACGASVEAELGYVGSAAEVLTAEESASRLTPIEEVQRFVGDTEVDALAVAIGTAHGLYRAAPKLDLDRLRAVRQVVSIPLVLHGGSGTPDEQVKQAIALGICKVNIWTELALAYARGLGEDVASAAERGRLPEALAGARANAQELVREKIRLVGAAGRAA